MVAEGQVPPNELASHTLEEFGNGFLTIFRLSQHALDGARSEPPARDVDWHGISTLKEVLRAQSCKRRRVPPRPLRIQENRHRIGLLHLSNPTLRERVGTSRSCHNRTSAATSACRPAPSTCGNQSTGSVHFPRENVTNPSRFGIFTFRSVCASIVSLSAMMPL